MKKLILLAAVALLSLGASAQDYNIEQYKTALSAPLSAETGNAKELRSKLLSGEGRIVTNTARTATRTVTPEGRAEEFFLLRNEEVDFPILKNLVQRLTKETVYFSEDGSTVYLPNMVWPSQFGTTPNYVKGTIEGAFINIPAGQEVGMMQMDGVTYEFYLAPVDIDVTSQTGVITPSTDPIKFYYDKNEGVISFMNPSGTQSYSGAYVGLFCNYIVNNAEYAQYINYDTGCMYYSHTFYDDPVNRSLSYVDLYSQKTGTGTVEDYDTALGYRFMKGLLPDFPNVYVLLQYAKNSENLITGLQVIGDNRVIFASDGTASIEKMETNSCPFIYTAATDTYSSNTTPVRTLRDLVYTEVEDAFGETENKYVYSHEYSNITIGPATPTGINNVQTSTDKEAVSVEYYDLSGRRISAVEKGVSIKVEKYADGTSKAVKVMK